jgi:hypothetical protein
LALYSKALSTDLAIMAPMTLSLQDRGLTSASGSKLISKENDCSGDEMEIGMVASVSGSDSSDFLRDESTCLTPRRLCFEEDLVLEGGLLGSFLSVTLGETLVLLRLCFDGDLTAWLLISFLLSETSGDALALRRLCFDDRAPKGGLLLDSLL